MLFSNASSARNSRSFPPAEPSPRPTWRRRSALATAIAGVLLLAATASAYAYPETTGPGPTHTFTNYHNATGQGTSIPDNSTVQITCRAEGFRVEDGNTWWYLVATSPWDNVYWASADAFYNDGRTSGSLKGTPFVDPNVPLCVPPAPSVATGSASSVSQSTATLSATVNPNGGNVTLCELEYGTSPSFGQSAPCSPSPGGGTGPVGVSAQVSGLQPNTGYYFRIVAGNAGGTSYGGEQTFSTLPNAPAVMTEGPSSVTQTTAILNATVNPEGGTVSECRFEYGSSPLYGSSVPCATSPGPGTSPEAVYASIEGLAANSTYYYRITATNTGGTSYGLEQTLTTPVEPPAVHAGSPSSVGQVSATLNATVDPNEEAVSECRFEYGTTEEYGSSAPCSPEPGSGSSPEPVSAELAGLTPGTAYHFRVVAANPGGTSKSPDETFQTAAPSLPELGRCVASTRATGRYKTSACTTKSSGEDTGRYEWQPWPAADDRFSASTGPVKLETIRKSAIKCSGGEISGEYGSSQTAAATIVFSGCEAPGALGGRCQSEGAEPGEIVTAGIEGRLGVIKQAKTPTVGWDLQSASEAPLATFQCGASAVTIVGSVIAPVTPLDKMTSSFKLKFAMTRGKQKPEAFASSPSDTLSFDTQTAEEQAGLAMTSPLAGGEPLEIKAIA